MRRDSREQRAFLTPIAHPYDGPSFIWRPGAKPTNLYRRSSAPWKLSALRAIMTTGWLTAIGSLAAVFLSDFSWPAKAGVVFITIILASLLGNWRVDGVYSATIRKIRRSWIYSLPVSEHHFPQSNLEMRLFDSLEKIQRSRAFKDGIIPGERIHELHKLVWRLVTSGQVLPKDAELLENTASEVVEVDRTLAERDTQTAYDEGRQTGSALVAHSTSLAEELRLFREFLERRDL